MLRASVNEPDQRYYRQVDRTAPSPTPSSSHAKIQPPSLSAIVEKRSVGNSTVSPPSFYTLGYDGYRPARTYDPDIESYSHHHQQQHQRSGNSLSAANQCRVASSFGASSSSVLPVETVPILPSSAQLDATVTCLWILTPLSATVSAVIVLVAITTNQWLHTEEKMSNPAYNGTGDKDYLTKLTVSGLWKICSTNRKLFLYVI